MYKDNIPTPEAYLIEHLKIDYLKKHHTASDESIGHPYIRENLPDFLTKDELHFHLVATESEEAVNHYFMVSTTDAKVHQKYLTTKYQSGILSYLHFILYLHADASAETRQRDY